MTTQIVPQVMDPNHLAVGDAIADSPVGPGHITGITEAGFPQVNHVAVARLISTDGIVFDPHGSYEKDAKKASEKAIVDSLVTRITEATKKEDTPHSAATDPISEEDFLNIIQSSQELSGRIALIVQTDTGTKLTSVAKTLLKACNRHLAYKS